MKVLAVYNVKGGVGKTTSSVNLAYLSSLENKTMLWDLDPQGASTLFLNESQIEDVKAKKIIKDKKEFLSLVKQTKFPNYSLVPSFFNLRYMDLILEDSKKSSKNLGKIFEKLRTRFQCIFIDCPPSISSLSESIFSLADALLVPVIPTTLSLQSLGQIRTHVKSNVSSKLKILPFFSMVDRRKKLHLEMIVDESSKGNVLNSSIPYRSVIEKMGVNRAPLLDYAPNCEEATAYRKLWQEMKVELKLT